MLTVVCGLLTEVYIMSLKVQNTVLALRMLALIHNSKFQLEEKRIAEFPVFMMVKYLLS